MTETSVALAGPADRQGIRRLLEYTSTPFDVDQELVRSYAKLWVAHSAPDRVLGFLLAWEVADEIHLLDLVVDREHRRRGIGTQLIGALIAHADGCSARVVLLEVRSGNAIAIALYQGLGFRVSGTRKGYYADGEDALELVRELVRERPGGSLGAAVR